MKTLKAISILMMSIMIFVASAKASDPETVSTKSATKIFTPVYKTLHDNDITYYIIKINGENVLMDSKGRVVKYLCDDDQLKSPEGYKLITIPANLLLR
jgi:uncharacterized protein (UPF0333 family)